MARLREPHPIHGRGVRAVASLFLIVLAVALGSAADDAGAGTILANPGTYRNLLRQLRPGDVLELAPGDYSGLPIRNLHGRADAPITVKGQTDRTVIVGHPSRNTISITDSSHVVIRDLRLEARGAATNGVVCERESSWTHHITIENLAIADFGVSQSTVGIATRCPAWAWNIRNNRIVRPGTGMYLGNSDGTGPFFAAKIEGNEILNPIGYGIQIKHQVARPEIEGMPTTQSSTVIRGNRIVKSEGASAGQDARPSLLVGHFPVTGNGSQDTYVIHSNILYDNPSEALFQGEGNIALYNNLLVNPRGDAVHIRPHNDRPRAVYIFHNTVVAAGVGISVQGAHRGFEQYVGSNAVFAAWPLEGELPGRNFVANTDRARDLLANPEGPFPALDLTPRGDALAADDDIPLSLSRFPSAREGFRGEPRTAPIFGACLGPVRGRTVAPCR